MTAPELRARLAPAGERLAAWLYPRRCPFCDALLGPGAPFAACCPACAQEERRLRHDPPRLPQSEHSFSALGTAAGAYYYAGAVRHAILLCKGHGRPWYARELADLALIHVFGAAPAKAPGGRPVWQGPAGLAPYSAIVPVPPRRGKDRTALPHLIAKRLGQVLGVPVLAPLRVARELKPQKTLTREERLRNVRGAYAVRPGTDLGGKRLLLVDDVITTGATVSACALALLEAGAVEVAAFCLAADEELPKEKRTPAQGGQKPQERQDP